MAGAPHGGESLPKQSLTPLGVIADVGLVEGFDLALGIEFRPGFGYGFMRRRHVSPWGCGLGSHIGGLEFGGQLMGPPGGWPAAEVAGGALGAFEGLGDTAGIGTGRVTSGLVTLAMGHGYRTSMPYPQRVVSVGAGTCSSGTSMPLLGGAGGLGGSDSLRRSGYAGPDPMVGWLSGDSIRTLRLACKYLQTGMCSKGREQVPEESKPTVGTLIRTRRLEKHLSQGALAAQVGVSQGTVKEWEAGRRTIRRVYVEPLARALDLPQHVLDAGVEQTPSGAAVDLGAKSSPREVYFGAMRELTHSAINVHAATREEVLQHLADLTMEVRYSKTSLPHDLTTQSEAARLVGITHQAVNTWVAQGRLKSYPNPDRPDRAPMVSLAEVQSLRARSQEPVAAEDGTSPNNHPTSTTTPENSGQESS